MKKKTLITIVCVILAAALLLLAGVQVRRKKWLINPLFVSRQDVMGVDLSRYQHDVDMNRLKEQNVRFAYIKATEGSNHVDKRFARNWANAEKAGLPAGAYHFFSYDSGGDTQAENYIRTVGDLAGRLIPVVDVEYYGDKEKNPPAKEAVVRELRIFLDRLEERYGVKAMIYTKPQLYWKYLKDEFDEYPKWIRSVFLPVWWVFRDPWSFWQYTDQGKLEGYSGGHRYIDLNVMNRKESLEDFMVKDSEAGR